MTHRHGMCSIKYVLTWVTTCISRRRCGAHGRRDERSKYGKYSYVTSSRRSGGGGATSIGRCIGASQGRANNLGPESLEEADSGARRDRRYYAARGINLNALALRRTEECSRHNLGSHGERSHSWYRRHGHRVDRCCPRVQAGGDAKSSKFGCVFRDLPALPSARESLPTVVPAGVSGSREFWGNAFGDCGECV